MNKKNKLLWIDSHAHFHLYPEKDRAFLIEKIQSNKSIKAIINVATNIESYRTNASLSLDFLPSFLSIGIHPSEAAFYKSSIKKEMELILMEKKAVAIGECGLDYYKYGSSSELVEKQKKLFLDQIHYSIEFKLPLIIHVRDAFEETYEILKKFFSKKDQANGVIHCFSGNLEFMEKFIKLGFFISFAGNLTFKKNTTIQEAAKNVPLDAFLLETDSPYLAPSPFRGFFPNDSTFIEYTASFLATLKNVSLEELSLKSVENTCSLFNLKIK